MLIKNDEVQNEEPKVLWDTPQVIRGYDGQYTYVGPLPRILCDINGCEITPKKFNRYYEAVDYAQSHGITVR